jgi:hypothetical protein
VKNWLLNLRGAGKALEMMRRPKEAINDETADAVHDLVRCDRKRENIARDVGISFGSVKAILAYIRVICAVWRVLKVSPYI